MTCEVVCLLLMGNEFCEELCFTLACVLCSEFPLCQLTHTSNSYHITFHSTQIDALEKQTARDVSTIGRMSTEIRKIASSVDGYKVEITKLQKAVCCVCMCVSEGYDGTILMDVCVCCD